MAFLEEYYQVTLLEFEVVADLVPCGLVKLVVAFRMMQLAVVLNDGPEDLCHEVGRVHQTLRRQSHMLILLDVDQLAALQVGPVTVVDLHTVVLLIIHHFIVHHGFASWASAPAPATLTARPTVVPAASTWAIVAAPRVSS